MKKFSVLILATLFVYNCECWVIKKNLEGAANESGNILGGLRHKVTTTTTSALFHTEKLPASEQPQPPASEVVEQAPSPGSYPEIVSTTKHSSTTTTAVNQSSNGSTTSSEEEGRAAIVAKDRCPTGQQKDGNGVCRPVFG